MMIKRLFSCTILCCICVSLKAQILQPSKEKELLATKQGGVVELPGFFENQKRSDIEYQKVILPGPQFIISDDPEYIRVPEGIALKETVEPGLVRLYVYNVNGVKEPEKIDRKISAVIKNIGNAPMHLRMVKYSSQKPSLDYFHVGKQGLADYFASKGNKKIRKIAHGKVVPVDEALEKHVVKYDELVHGFYEFVIDQPAEIAVVQTAPGKSGSEAYNEIKSVIPFNHKNAGRGLFGVSNYKVFNNDVIDTKNGVSELIVADGKKDPWVIGIEGVSGQLSRLAGNYGVMYDIELIWKSSDGKGLALVTWNSRSADNKWCSGMAASMVVSEGVHKAGIVKLPEDKTFTKSAPEAVVIQVFKPDAIGAEQILRLKYSPPGASCLPTPLIFIPVDLK